MSCRAFESRLEAYLGGRLPRAEQRDAESHLAGCSVCRELVELARLGDHPEAQHPPTDLTARVLGATTGSACRTAERSLCALIDGELSTAEAELVRGHLALCGECAALARVVDTLVAELPTLADIRPDREFARSVLAATLPWRTRAQRWWRHAWPRWIVRPRFALEAAYVATVILVVVFTTPVSPLEAMPRRAVEIVRAVPEQQVASGWERLEARIVSTVDSARRSESVAAVVDGWRETFALGDELLGRARATAEGAPGWGRERLRTFRDWLASVLGRADSDPATADSESDEETS